MAGVLSGDLLSLRSDTTLLSVSVGSLLAAVEKVGIILGDLSRILGSDLVDGGLEVALLGKVRLLLGAQGARLGCGTLLVGRSKTLSISRDAVLGGLGLTSRAGFTRFEVVGIFGCDRAGILLHLAQNVLSSTLEVLVIRVSKVNLNRCRCGA